CGLALTLALSLKAWAIDASPLPPGEGSGVRGNLLTPGPTLPASNASASDPGEVASPLQTSNFKLQTAAGPSFRRHVVPLLGRLGCNSRACHGSFQGQGGFKLSLFGYDFAADHAALVSGDSARIDRSDPAASLILEKPTLAIPHKGGRRFEKGSWQY